MEKWPNLTGQFAFETKYVLFSDKQKAGLKQQLQTVYQGLLGRTQNRKMSGWHSLSGYLNYKSGNNGQLFEDFSFNNLFIAV